MERKQNMLKLRNMIEDDTIASGLLKNYDFKELQFGFCRSSSNVVYWVKGDGKLFFLRYTTEDERTPKSILAEINYLNYLREHGISANRPVETKNGTYFIQENGYLAVLFECVKGKPLDDIELTPEIAKGWGRELGKLHELSGAYMEQTSPIPYKRPDYKDAFTYIRLILEQSNDVEIRKKATLLENSLNQIVQTKSNYGLCHYDFELDNIYWDQENNRFSIIDFDDSMYHFYAIDLVQVMMNIEEELPEESQKRIKDNFLEGYQEYKALPLEVELKSAGEFVQLLSYAKLTYSLSYPPENEPEWMTEVVEKLQRARSRKRRQLLDIARSER